MTFYIACIKFQTGFALLHLLNMLFVVSFIIIRFYKVSFVVYLQLGNLRKEYGSHGALDVVKFKKIIMEGRLVNLLYFFGKSFPKWVKR